MLMQSYEKKNKGLGELHHNEIALINFWRNNVRYGEITIVIQDGVPKRLLKYVESKNLADM